MCCGTSDSQLSDMQANVEAPPAKCIVVSACNYLRHIRALPQAEQYYSLERLYVTSVRHQEQLLDLQVKLIEHIEIK